jgi:UDP-GlcNAc:undecaprenyl-phosphate GlcNAc-1-phosphate transferase
VTDFMWLAVKAFLACLILTPIFRDIFRTYGVVDKPDLHRKVHVYPIPRVGGIPIALAYAIALFPFGSGGNLPWDGTASLAWRLGPAAALVFATGLIDDPFGLKPWQKLIGQVAAAGLAYWAGIRLISLGGYNANVWFSLPVTIFWLLLCTNAFNLVDGLDGLAAGMAMVASLTLFAASLVYHNQFLASATLPLAGALLGFLFYNFNPATVFLGDSGSLLLGFLLGCFGLVWSQNSPTLLGLTVPLLALSVPLLDVSLAVARRFLRNQPIFSADRGHIHHRLLDRGFSARSAVLVLYLLAGLAAAFALLITLPYGGRYRGIVILAFCAVAWVCVRQLRYAEFEVAGQILFGGKLLRNVGGQLRLGRFTQDLKRVRSEDDCFRALETAARDFGFSAVKLSLRGRVWNQVLVETDSHQCWSLIVPLNPSDSVTLWRPFQSDVLPMMVAAFVDAVRQDLRTKLLEMDSGSGIQSMQV